jgi:lysophospholipase
MGNAAPLVSIPEAPVPDHGKAEWFSGADGATLRAAFFSPKGAAVAGSVVVSPGRSEPIEKYFEVVQDLLDRGFVVLVHDWRGQGLSHRALPDRLKGHAAGFKEFLGDYQALLAAFETRLPKPWIALGHSMGGCLTMLALATGESRFAAAVLSAPMLGLNTGGKPAGAARALAWLMSRSRYKGDYVLGDVGDPFVQSFPEGRPDPRRGPLRPPSGPDPANPDIALGGITWGWTDFAFSACAFLRRTKGVEAVSIPVTIVAAGQDSRVLIADEKSIAGRIPQGRYVEIPDAFHEILIETDDRRAVFWKAFRSRRLLVAGDDGSVKGWL